MVCQRGLHLSLSNKISDQKRSIIIVLNEKSRGEWFQPVVQGCEGRGTEGRSEEQLAAVQFLEPQPGQREPEKARLSEEARRNGFRPARH